LGDFGKSQGGEAKGESATIMRDFGPGEAAQVDFGQGPPLPDPKSGQMASIRIFLMTLCFSRTQYAKIAFDQTAWTWCGLHRRAFEFLGGHGHAGHHRHLTCASRKACDYDPEVRRSFRESAEG
jgi:hypothetical protein